MNHSRQVQTAGAAAAVDLAGGVLRAEAAEVVRGHEAILNRAEVARGTRDAHEKHARQPFQLSLDTTDFSRGAKLF